MVNDEPEQPSHGHEFAPLEDSPPFDPYTPVDYPADPPPPPDGGVPYQQPGYPPPGYAAYPGGYPPYPGGYPPYPGGYSPYDPYGPTPPYGTNGKAIAALVTSLVGVVFCGCFVPSIIAMVLGFVAMAETKRTGQAGHGMALAGVIVGAVTLIVGVFVIIAALNDPSLTDYG